MINPVGIIRQFVLKLGENGVGLVQHRSISHKDDPEFILILSVEMLSFIIPRGNISLGFFAC